jgi:hypothetical protein
LTGGYQLTFNEFCRGGGSNSVALVAVVLFNHRLYRMCCYYHQLRAQSRR